MTERTITGNAEVEERAIPSQPVAVSAGAHLISYVFHPVLLPVYVACFLLFVHPLLFAGYSLRAKINLTATVFVNLCFLPLITVFLCWRLKFISNIFLNTQKERIIPLAATMVFYFWGWFVLRNFTEIPGLFRQFLLGCFITIIAAWLANIYYKISLHALGAGGMACFIFLAALGSVGASGQYIAIAWLVAGAICTARLLVSDHRPFEVYSGLFIGIFCQLLAAWLN